MWTTCENMWTNVKTRESMNVSQHSVESCLSIRSTSQTSLQFPICKYFSFYISCKFDLGVDFKYYIQMCIGVPLFWANRCCKIFVVWRLNFVQFILQNFCILKEPQSRFTNCFPHIWRLLRKFDFGEFQISNGCINVTLKDYRGCKEIKGTDYKQMALNLFSRWHAGNLYNGE